MKQLVTILLFLSGFAASAQVVTRPYLYNKLDSIGNRINAKADSANTPKKNAVNVYTAGQTIVTVAGNQLRLLWDGARYMNVSVLYGVGTLGTGSHAAFDLVGGAPYFEFLDPVYVTNLTISGTITGANDIEITDNTKGVILKSPNGTRWRITISDAGVISGTSL